MAWYLPCGVVTLYIVKAVLDKCVLSKTDGVCDELEMCRVCLWCVHMCIIIMPKIIYCTMHVNNSMYILRVEVVCVHHR